MIRAILFYGTTQIENDCSGVYELLEKQMGQETESGPEHPVRILRLLPKRHAVAIEESIETSDMYEDGLISLGIEVKQVPRWNKQLAKFCDEWGIAVDFENRLPACGWAVALQEL